MSEDLEWAEFLDRLIHDLREPLRSIHAFSELLRENGSARIGSDAEEALGQILSGTSRIRTLVDGVSGYALALRETPDSAGPGPPTCDTTTPSSASGATAPRSSSRSGC